ncbi:hypothetical protein DXT76_04070 [Halobacillus trueperi]|uniref:Uncharacterized protein n=1 Tax=Halobacillus trueperi TaxID=156205 RepID=A0A3D8VTE6_9BACI|nr:hypothetical protein DXT76_04070 [Halobacillus trueperi]
MGGYVPEKNTSFILTSVNTEGKWGCMVYTLSRKKVTRFLSLFDKRKEKMESKKKYILEMRWENRV